MKQFRHFFTISTKASFKVISKNHYNDKLEALEELNNIINEIANNENGFVIYWNFWNDDNDAEIVIKSEKNVTTVRMYSQKEVA